MNKKLKKIIEQDYVKRFNINPFIIFSPGRINIIGEHTDYNGGFVLPAAINKGIYLAIQKSKTSNSTIVSIDEKETYTFKLKNLKPLNNGGWKNYILGVVAEIQKKEIEVGNFNIVFSGDIPLGAGLSSSAALENAVVFGLNKLFNLKLSKQEMILISQKSEHNFVGVKCGIMDQYASMFGKKNTALHINCKTLKAFNYPLNLNNYELILINSNIKHSLANSAYNKRRAVCEKAAKLLEIDSLCDANESTIQSIFNLVTEEEFNKITYVIQENERTKKAVTALNNNNIKKLGDLLFESHKGLSKKYNVSCNELDFLVNEAKKSDAVIGARMMGGGFGGCTINIVKTSKKDFFLKDVQQKYYQKFANNCSVYEVNTSAGTKIISY